MINNIRKFIDENKIVCLVRSYYESILYPATISIIILLSYLLKIEFIGQSIIVLLFAVGMLTTYDLKVFIPPLLGFIFIIPNRKVSLTDNVYLNVYNKNTWYIIFLAVIVLLIFVLKFILQGGFLHKIKKPSALFIATLTLTAVMFLNGIFNENYTPYNLIYALVLFVCWFFLYFIFLYNLNFNEKTIKYVLYTCLFLSVVLIIQLLNCYISNNVIINGTIKKSNIILGWGIQNNLASILVILMPAIYYLAYLQQNKLKCAFYYLIASITYLAVIFTECRSGILTGLTIGIICTFILCVKAKQKHFYQVFCIAFALIITVFILIFKENIYKLFESLFRAGLSDSSRFNIWKNALNEYKKHPLFGMGFYASQIGSYTQFLPGFYHNTVVEILSCCGAITLAIYAVYRFLTVKLMLTNFNLGKIFLSLMILAIISTSLVDNTIFNIYPTFFYSLILALLERESISRKEI